MSHTPGPWTYVLETAGGVVSVTIKAGDTEVVGGCGCCGSPWYESEDDLRLIASAPDLLRALQGLMYMDCGEPAFHVAREALAKATT